MRRIREDLKEGLGAVRSLAGHAQHSPAHGRSHLAMDHRLCLRGSQDHQSPPYHEAQSHHRSHRDHEGRRNHLEELCRHVGRMEEQQVLWHVQKQKRQRQQDQWAEPWSLKERGSR